MTRTQKRDLCRILIVGAVFAALLALEHFEILQGWVLFALYLAAYLAVGYDVLLQAGRNIAHGQVFDENFLMTVASIAAFAIGQYEEAVAVMLFYQLGELLQSVAVGRSRRSISQMMEIVPEYANLESDGKLTKVDPDEVPVGSVITVLPGERIPLDGVVVEGETLVDTAALTGESVPRRVSVGCEVISGCICGSEPIKVKTTKAYEDSTVSRILELVENAGEKKATAERFISRFARYYTPAVTAAAVLLAVLPPLAFAQPWGEWIRRACVFLVVSCPCALVISVPLGFFGGIGASSKIGVLIKGGNYLEALSKAETVAFDKTGTLTQGVFTVTEIAPNGETEASLLELAALGEGYCNHPIAASIRAAYGKALDLSQVSDYEEISGRGIRASIGGAAVLLGNRSMLLEQGIDCPPSESFGTVVYCAKDGRFVGTITISDRIKPEAKDAIRAIKALGVSRCVMLTGDRSAAAEQVAAELKLDAFHADLLPGDKVACVERLLSEGTLLFVGDGMNDAPVLRRADVGAAMGSMGSDAAIEAADVVVMDSDLRKLAASMQIAKKTMRIVRENIVFALAVKAIILLLGALGIASMWLAVFGDVGVAMLAILNSMRALRVPRL